MADKTIRITGLPEGTTEQSIREAVQGANISRVLITPG